MSEEIRDPYVRKLLAKIDELQAARLEIARLSKTIADLDSDLAAARVDLGDAEFSLLAMRDELAATRRLAGENFHAAYAAEVAATRQMADSLRLTIASQKAGTVALEKALAAARREAEEMREALQPFAEAAGRYSAWADERIFEGFLVTTPVEEAPLNVGDLRRAARAIAKPASAPAQEARDEQPS